MAVYSNLKLLRLFISVNLLSDSDLKGEKTESGLYFDSFQVEISIRHV